ncbi:MAG: VWA domain-containing protein, partial [Acidobacteriota bacterium]
MVVALMLGLWLSAVAMGEAQKADTVAGAQQQPKEEAGQKTPAVTAQQAGVVNVNVLVTDEDGRTIPGLKKENFRVLDNGTPVTVQSLSPTSTPITVVMLLEYSSLAYGYYAGKATYWAAGFLDHLEPRDWVGLVTYDLHSRVRIDFTHNRAAVLDAIGSLGIPTYSESNLFDGLIDTVEMMDRVRGRKTILLLTTGANSFSAASFDDVRRRLRSSDVTIFCVGLAEEEVVRSA